MTQKLSQLGWTPMSIDQCLWCRYSDDGELKGVIGIHVDDFLIGLADGDIREKWMSEIKSLYRWKSGKTSESECAAIRVHPPEFVGFPVLSPHAHPQSVPCLASPPFFFGGEEASMFDLVTGR